MIYLFTLVLCLYPAWVYDVIGKKTNYDFWYWLILMWVISLSGLQYKVGSDTENYMYLYEHYYATKIIAPELHAQPGWGLVSFLCRQLTADYTLFKIVHAVFFNVAVFSFFRRESKYVFICIFLYLMADFLLLNFNTIRQSFAIGFCLFFISYYKRQDYLKAFVFLFLAFMFHNTAALLLAVPAVSILLRSNKYIFYFAIMTFILLTAWIYVNFADFVVFIINSGYIGSEMTEQGASYLQSTRIGLSESLLDQGTLINLIIIVLINVLYFKKTKDKFFLIFGMLYFFFVFLTKAFPAIFRLRLYFDFVYFIMFSKVIMELRIKDTLLQKKLIIVLFLIFFSYIPCYQYFTKNPEAVYPRYIDQYYPYRSIFDR